MKRGYKISFDGLGGVLVNGPQTPHETEAKAWGTRAPRRPGQRDQEVLRSQRDRALGR